MAARAVVSGGWVGLELGVGSGKGWVGDGPLRQGR